MPNLTSTQLALIGTLATTVAAVIAAIVSILTTRYIVKHGPNYDEPSCVEVVYENQA
jgi:MFS-type transporter involved in bile tolerance (Atg22 family)